MMRRVPGRWGGLLLGLCLSVAVPSGAVAAQIAPVASPAAGGVPLDALKQTFRRPAATPFPETNPYTREKAALGKALFFDPRLSRTGSVSCASCHNPSLGWSDGLPRAVGYGMKPLARRTPSVLNLAWGAAFQWDGRAPSLETQAVMPISAPDEMNMTMDLVAERLKAIAGYRPLFDAAFGPGAEIGSETVTAALATFQRTLVSGEAPFDRWVEGDDRAIGPEAVRGFQLFTGKARCSSCHAGWRFTDDSFHDIGLHTTDLGRGKFVPPAVVAMQHAFKTPSLRDLRLQGPYGHNGGLASLDAVLDHYARGGEKRPSLSYEMRALELSPAERADLVAFLKTLQAPPAPIELPLLP
ncbi:tryptophan tryptophylquinone biosynthesis enzyme MauG [Chthonobacter rhizosphaerae]|uniref:tryptophan tryptophylquinone biosynthesis enzyme MauG n=1 Tax=Chthonobacter rhizosphaerae TaxID=2735553 RepID=UPI001FE3D929|nr:tryptophan tryptophylquinone biosynthesis enzyme MauG [Chthonobacter rhizosphaerae]